MFYFVNCCVFLIVVFCEMLCFVNCCVFLIVDLFPEMVTVIKQFADENLKHYSIIFAINNSYRLENIDFDYSFSAPFNKTYYHTLSTVKLQQQNHFSQHISS